MTDARATRSISILGEPRISIDAGAVPVAARRERAVLTLLALAEGAPVSASTLVESIWGDSPPATARKVVQVLVGRIRTALGDPAVISTTSEGYALAVDGWTFTHVSAERALDHARRLAQGRDWHGVIGALDGVVGMWHGPSLGSFATEPWAIDVARRLDAARDEARFLLASGWLETGAQERATVSFMELVALDPEALGPRIALARSLGAGGRVAEALGWCRSALSDARDRGAQDAVETLRALERTLLAGGHSVASGPQLPRVPIARHPMLGRDVEHASVRRALDTARIATIVGPGGTGKTRLAMAVASELQHVRDVAWIDWSAARSSGEAIGVLLVSLGISSIPGDPIDALVQAIDDRRLLLVLDNAEQVIDVRGDVEQLVRRCANLSVLATSRIAFGIEGEHVEPLAPLDLVDDLDDTRGADLDELPAVRLFRDRSALVGGIPVSDPATLRDIHRICALVDGLPLGIELAAARSGLLSPRDMVQQLERTLDLLATRSDEHPARHRSLDRVIAWSYDLLDDEARWMFAVLSMFEGGGELEDIAFAANRSESSTRGLLAMLDGHSLAIREDDGSAPRWKMLATVATFGRELLDSSVGGHDARRRWTARMIDHVQSANVPDALRTGAEHRLVTERSNIDASFEWAMNEHPNDAASIFVNLDRYLHTRGSFFEGEDLGRRIEPHVDRVDPELRVGVLALMGRMLHYRGDAGRSLQLLEQSLEQAKELHLSEQESLSLVWLAERVRMMGRLEDAIDFASRAKQIGERVQNSWLVALSVAQLGFAEIDREQTSVGLAAYEQAISLFWEVGDDYWGLFVDANRCAVDVVERRKEELVAELAMIAGRLTEMQYWTAATHVKSFELRCLLELGHFEAAATIAGHCAAQARSTGEQVLLMFVQSCAAIAYLESGFTNLGIRVARESIELALESEHLFFVDYGLTVLTICSETTDRAEALVSNIDTDRLRGSVFALDRHVGSMLDRRFGTPREGRAATLEDLRVAFADHE